MKFFKKGKGSEKIAKPVGSEKLNFSAQQAKTFTKICDTAGFLQKTYQREFLRTVVILPAENVVALKFFKNGKGSEKIAKQVGSEKLDFSAQQAKTFTKICDTVDFLQKTYQREFLRTVVILPVKNVVALKFYHSTLLAKDVGLCSAPPTGCRRSALRRVCAKNLRRENPK